MDFQTQVQREGFPAGTQVTTFTEPAGRVFRVTGEDGARGLDLLLTDEAVRMYGEGPSLALVLGCLRERAEAGLPPARTPGVYERQVFVGD